MKTIAITVGDINGIGPEVVLKAVHNHKWPHDLRFVIIGHKNTLTFTQPKHSPPITLLEPPQTPRALRYHPGKIRADASAAAVAWIEAAVLGCLAGEFDAMVTAPICKEGLHKAGIQIPGHTEYLAALTKTTNFAMMLIGGPLRVVLATRHIPYRAVPKQLTAAKITTAATLAAQSLPWLGLPDGKIGICALNPHGGDGGVLGTEEQTVITPTIRQMQKHRLPVVGPIPADVIFHQAVHGQYAAVVAMYHDQGLAPLKMLAFNSGVNLTLGLPIIRTSPDHGTAFDIAGKDKADASSMIAAIKLAYRLSKKANPWKQ